jgi:hypothetical protein
VRKGPTIALMIGMPSPMAHEPQSNEGPELDGDRLDREDHEQFDHGPTNTLDLLYERLKHGDEVAAHAAMAIARCIQEMAHQAARGDQAGLRHWYEKCSDLIADVDGEDEEDGNG